MTENTHTSCQEQDCDRRHYARGWCEMHYRRWRRRGSTSDRRTADTCQVAGCEHPHDARGWCHGHYQRWLRTGTTQPLVPLGRERPVMSCEVAQCTAEAHAHGLCVSHYRRLQRVGDVRADRPLGAVAEDGLPLDGARRARGWITQGYRYVPVDARLRGLVNGKDFEAEHRLVMAEHLGRPLRPDESVHHRNGDKLDNRLANLELWSAHQPAGQRISDKVVWAVEILERYAPEHLRPT